MWNAALPLTRSLAIAEPVVDLRVFREGMDVRSGDHVLGSTTPLPALLSLLADDPERVTLCVGAARRRAEIAFHLAAIRALDADEYAGLFGWRSAGGAARTALLAKVAAVLPPGDAPPFLPTANAVERGLLEDSQTRRLLRRLEQRLREGIPEDEVDGFVGRTPMTSERRRELFATWRTRHRWFWTRWCLALRLAPRRFLANHLGLELDASARFLRRTVSSLLDSLERVLFEGLATNPVFEHALTGRIPAGFFERFLDPAIYETIRRRIDRVTTFPHALFDAASDDLARGRVDRLFLGIGPVLEQPPREGQLSRRCARLLRPSGRVLALSLLPRDPLRAFEGLTPLERESILLTTRESTGLYPLVSVHRAREPHDAPAPNGDRLVSMS